MKMPDCITSVISFEIAKLHLEKGKIYVKQDKRVKKLIKITTRYIKKLTQLKYEQVKVWFDDTEYIIKD